jgi:hypothetical protein
MSWTLKLFSVLHFGCDCWGMTKRVGENQLLHPLAGFRHQVVLISYTPPPSSNSKASFPFFRYRNNMVPFPPKVDCRL